MKTTKTLKQNLGSKLESGSVELRTKNDSEQVKIEKLNATLKRAEKDYNNVEKMRDEAAKAYKQALEQAGKVLNKAEESLEQAGKVWNDAEEALEEAVKQAEGQLKDMQQPNKQYAEVVKRARKSLDDAELM